MINLQSDDFEVLRNCVWDGPEGFPSKAILCPLYGRDLERLFRGILEVRDVTSAEAQNYLEELRQDGSTTMVTVTKVYVYIQSHCIDSFVLHTLLDKLLLTQDSFRFSDGTVCIATPSLSRSSLEWRAPAQCVWGDEEFSRNGLSLESKFAIRPIIEQRAPTAEPFFTGILNLRNAGINELLSDLALMQKKRRVGELKRVYRLYERIENDRRSYRKTIRHVSAFSG